MPISLSHREVRDLAKNLRDLTGRDVKHTQILEAIAKAVGRPADSMMHELKNENLVAAAMPEIEKAPGAEQMVLRVGFSQSPNGRRGRWIMRVLERRDPDPATLAIVIEPTADLRWLPQLDPAQPMWSVKAIHTGKAWSADKVERDVGSVGSDGVTLHSAINIAFELIGTRHHLWSKADKLEAEYDLHELNPLAYAELESRNTAEELESRRAYEEGKARALQGADPESPIGKARLAGFKPQADSRGRPILAKEGFLVTMRGPSWHLELSSDHPDGVDAPADESIWRMHVVFADYQGRLVAPIYKDLDSVTMETAVVRAEALQLNIKEIEAVWEKARKQKVKKAAQEMTSEDSRRIATQAGFEIWNTGGGCIAFAKLLREEPTPGGDKVSMDLMITVEGGCSIDAAPNERVWGAGINFKDPRGGDTPLNTDTDDLTLEEAIAVAREFEQRADRVWDDNYDPAAIAEYENRFRFS